LRVEDECLFWDDMFGSICPQNQSQTVRYQRLERRTKICNNNILSGKTSVALAPFSFRPHLSVLTWHKHSNTFTQTPSLSITT